MIIDKEKTFAPSYAPAYLSTKEKLIWMDGFLAGMDRAIEQVSKR